MASTRSVSENVKSSEAEISTICVLLLYGFGEEAPEGVGVFPEALQGRPPLGVFVDPLQEFFDARLLPVRVFVPSGVVDHGTPPRLGAQVTVALDPEDRAPDR